MASVSKYKALLLSLSIVIMGVISNQAKACHFAAADIYVTYTGAGIDGCSGTTEYKYDIDLIVYLGCQNCYLDPGTTQTVSYISQIATDAGLGGASGNITVTDANTRPDTSHQLCPAFAPLNSCNDLNNKNLYPAFRVRRYKGQVTLPYPQTDWRFYWSNGGRNTSNLTGCGSLYIEAGLNNLTKYNNSTPRFLSNPLPYICINQPTTYLNSPFDINGDSMMVYQQTPYTPGGTTGTPCGYAAGYSVADPIGSDASNPYKLNPVTGAATFTPTNQGFFVLAFRAEDYERGTGTLLSYVFRDVQVSVLQCTAPPPGIDSADNISVNITGGKFIKTTDKGEVVYACPGNNLQFDINSQTDSATHNIYMSSNNAAVIPASNFTVNGQGTNNVTGTFTWTPTTNDYGEHSLVVISKDSTCAIWQPIVLTNYRVIQINIVEGIDAGPDVPICDINPTPQQMFVKGTDNLVVSWTTVDGGPAVGISDPTIHNPLADPDVTTSYRVYTPDLVGSCKNSDTVTVYLDTTISISILPKNPVIQCRPDYVQLEAVIKGRPPVSNAPCGLSLPTKCAKDDTVVIYGSPVYGKTVYDTLGASTPIMVNNKYTQKQQFLISKYDLRESDLYSSTINKIGFECINGSLPLYKYNNFTISMKCTEKTQLKVTDGFETGLTEVYYSAYELLDNSWHDYKLNKPYTWDTTKNLIIEICYSDNETIVTNCSPTSGTPPTIRFVPTTYVSGLKLIAPNTTIKSVCATIADPNMEALQSRPVFRFGYCEANPKPFTINWTPGKYLSDSTIEQPLAYVPQSTDYVVETFGRNGCIIRDTVSIFVPKHDFDIFPKDSSICFGDKTPMYVTNGFSYRWYEYESHSDTYLPATSLNCQDCQYVIASPKKTTTYRVSVSDSVWCYDTLEVTLNVMKLPEVRILNRDTTIKYGQSIKLLATGARMYNWTPVSSLNNPNISYPIATPTEATRYIVGGLAANGCRSFDTLFVSVDYRDNLFVPSAFSPNGDGKNDVFRVANLTFQRILEFRVFNRWGQEIFSGAGSNTGWDGTWKGVPQDMGNYNYIIRVASPDGQTDTYKGEVTLIR